MHNKRFLVYLAIMTSLLLFVSSVVVMAASVPRMTTDELKAQLGKTDYQVLDVRSGGDWASSNVKIAGAERVEPRALGQWIDNYDKEQTIVLYCA
jgi:rhodanese-related sulfurtransferase